MEKNLSKKIIIGVTLGIGFVVFILVGNHFYSKRLDQVAKDYKEIILDSGWATEEKYKNKQDEEIISLSIDIMEEKLKEKYVFYKIDNNLNAEISEVKKLISSQKYFDSLTRMKGVLKAAEEDFSHYQEANSENIEEIDKKLIGFVEKNGFKVINYRIKDDWAVVTIIAPERKLDPANIVFKRTEQEWEAVAGPGTFFPESFLVEKGAPAEIIEKANDISEKDFSKD